MNNSNIPQIGLDLANRSEIVMLGTLNADGFPVIRAMLKMENQELRKVWLSTNTSSGKIEQVRRNPHASLYLVDEAKFIGLLLLGTVEILQDAESRKRFWKDGFEMYYPQGVNDPDYSVLCFTSQSGVLYHDLSVEKFTL